jgi:type VI protein secretion system component VasK
MPQEDGWHLSRSVPATLVLGLIAQAAAIVWTVSMMMSNIEGNATDIGNITNRMQRVENMVQAQAVSMARIDTNIEHIRTAVEKMARP